MLHGDLQYLHYDLVDMHKLSPKIQEIMEFQRRLNVKQILIFFRFGRLKQIFSDLNNFLDLHTCRTGHGDKIIFWE
jgi:hypothetical protein